MTILKMTKLVFVLAILWFAPRANAYLEKTYECENGSGVPKNTYKIENLSLGGAQVPYIEVENYYRESPGDASSPVEHSTLRGFATVATSRGVETLLIAALNIEFEKDEIRNCRKLLALSRALRPSN